MTQGGDGPAILGSTPAELHRHSGREEKLVSQGRTRLASNTAHPKGACCTTQLILRAHTNVFATQLLGRLFGIGSEAVVADAADFGTGDGDLNVAVAGDLVFELFVEARFKFADFTAAEAGYVDVIAWAVGFVIVTVATKVEKIEFVDESLTFEEVDGAVDGDQMDVLVDMPGAF
jgi:hypothetical protein